MKLGYVTAFALFLGGQAQALSCAYVDVIDAYQRADAAEEPYLILRGRVDVPANALPSIVEGGAAPSPVVAEFTGMGLMQTGFDVPFAQSVILNPSCAGPWCGSFPSGEDVLAFARVDDEGGINIDLTPCGQWVFPSPTAQVIDQVVACMNEGCSAQSLQ